MQLYNLIHTAKLYFKHLINKKFFLNHTQFIRKQVKFLNKIKIWIFNIMKLWDKVINKIIIVVFNRLMKNN